ncbi:hypothetical protein ACGFYU_11810 [Streptomyces sp. NPDC048337]|uniref:hypothetical protein n=1 Tax=Streptomyces sp. NPDC048337 TaxID=3365535 RepID=UPI003717AD5A
MLRLVVDFYGTPDDMEAGVAARTARAQYVGQEGRTFHILLGGQALYTNLGGPEVRRSEAVLSPMRGRPFVCLEPWRSRGGRNHAVHRYGNNSSRRLPTPPADEVPHRRRRSRLITRTRAAVAP